MPRTRIQDGDSPVELDYATAGSPDSPCLLLVAGLGEPRTWWPDRLVSLLVDRGFHVVTFDNRDAGRSTRIEAAGKVSQDTLVRALQGEVDDPPYSLAAMARDARGLLDHLGIDRAHVVGHSLGAIIAQHLGFVSPDRVTSLVLMMSTTGESGVGEPTDGARRTMMSTPPRERDAFVRHWVQQARTIGGSLLEETELRERAVAIFEHGYYPEGVARQFLAILSDGDRTDRLRSIDVPTLVIHGADDPLVDVSGGRAVAEAVPGAELVVLDDVGHELPRRAMEELTGLVAEHVRSAEGAMAGERSSASPQPADRDAAERRRGQG